MKLDEKLDTDLDTKLDRPSADGPPLHSLQPQLQIARTFDKLPLSPLSNSQVNLVRRLKPRKSFAFNLV